jgi:hypothetical protein
MALPAGPRVLLDETDEQPGDADLIARHIRPHPQKGGRAYAFFPEHGTSVAAVVRTLRENDGDLADTADTWGMTEDEVRAGVAYYRRYRDYIDARIVIDEDQHAPRGWFVDAFGSR